MKSTTTQKGGATMSPRAAKVLASLRSARKHARLHGVPIIYLTPSGGVSMCMEASPLRGLSEQHDEKYNHHNEAKSPAGIIAPAATVWPRWQRTDEQEQQDN